MNPEDNVCLITLAEENTQQETCGWFVYFDLRINCGCDLLLETLNKIFKEQK